MLEPVLVDINVACKTIESLPQKRQRFVPWEAVQKAVNDGMHPDAIRLTITDMAKVWDTPKVRTPWGWWRGVLENNSKNAWEKTEVSKAEGYKQALAEASASGLLETLGLKIKTL